MMMDIEQLCEYKTLVTVWIGEAKYNGIITKVGIVPGHIGRIGFSLKDSSGRIFLITELCTIKVNDYELK